MTVLLQKRLQKGFEMDDDSMCVCGHGVNAHDFSHSSECRAGNCDCNFFREKGSTKPFLTCAFCKEKKSWQEFHFGTANETTPPHCKDCRSKGKVKRTFLKK